ncbi:MAG: N-acetylmuramoyl-L-alanine amidase [Clostridia bacterium]|nr:N-acetylmuramoyl-L-alanine amidase [Clostridia bacterium]
MSYTFHTLTAKSLSYGSTRSASAIKYIILHYTGNKTDTAKGNANYFGLNGSNTRKAGAHYFVDDTTVYQSIPDTRIAWAVGGSKYSDCKSTGGGTMYGTITNSNSISIEMCSKNGAITDATIANAVVLTKTLMTKYSIPASRVYRHFDVNGKSCPGWTGWIGKKNYSKWTAFKSKLTEITVTALTKTVTVVSDDGTLNVRSGPGTSYSVIGSLSSGQTAEVVGVSGNWYKIKYDSDYGYISSVYTVDTASTNANTSNQEDKEMVESTPHVINGVKKNFNAITKDGITYVSLRELCATLGLKLSYNSTTKERVVELNNVEVMINGNAINAPGAFLNADTHLAAIGPMLREMGYDVRCTEAYHLTATLSNAEETMENT